LSGEARFCMRGQSATGQWSEVYISFSGSTERRLAGLQRIRTKAAQEPVLYISGTPELAELAECRYARLGLIWRGPQRPESQRSVNYAFSLLVLTYQNVPKAHNYPQNSTLYSIFFSASPNLNLNLWKSLIFSENSLNFDQYHWIFSVALYFRISTEPQETLTASNLGCLDFVHILCLWCSYLWS